MVRALLWLFLSIPLSSKMITPKEILNCFISREDFENWIEFEYLMITPFKKKKKKKASWKPNVWGWILLDFLPKKHRRQLLGCAVIVQCIYLVALPVERDVCCFEK